MIEGFNLEHIAVLITAIGSAGAFWKYVTFRAEQANKLVLNDRADRVKFNETLGNQIARLEEKIDSLVNEKEELLRDIASLRSDLAAANTTIKHLEELLRSRN